MGEKILEQHPIRDGSEKEFHLEMKRKKLEKPVPVVPNSYTPNLPYESWMQMDKQDQILEPDLVEDLVGVVHWQVNNRQEIKHIDHGYW